MSYRTSRIRPATGTPLSGPVPVTDPTAAAAGPTASTTPAPPTAAVIVSAAPAVVAPAEPEALEPPTFQLSFKQLLAGAAAAVTAAVLGSRLGVAGTLIGAALASSVSMIAAAVYSHSLATAAYKVKGARAQSDTVAAAPTEQLTLPSQAWGQLPPAASPTAAPMSVSATVRPPELRTPPRSPRSWRARWVAGGLGVVAACALALLAVTGIEAVRGTPLSGGTPGGLSVLGGASVGTPDSSATTGRTSSGSPTTTVSTGSDSPESTTDVTDGPATSTPATDPTSTTVTSTVTVTPTTPAADLVRAVGSDPAVVDGRRDVAVRPGRQHRDHRRRSRPGGADHRRSCGAHRADHRGAGSRARRLTVPVRSGAGQVTAPLRGGGRPDRAGRGSMVRRE